MAVRTARSEGVADDEGGGDDVKGVEGEGGGGDNVKGGEGGGGLQAAATCLCLAAAAAIEVTSL